MDIAAVAAQYLSSLADMAGNIGSTLESASMNPVAEQHVMFRLSQAHMHLMEILLLLSAPNCGPPRFPSPSNN